MPASVPAVRIEAATRPAAAIPTGPVEGARDVDRHSPLASLGHHRPTDLRELQRRQVAGAELRRAPRLGGLGDALVGGDRDLRRRPHDRHLLQARDRLLAQLDAGRLELGEDARRLVGRPGSVRVEPDQRLLADGLAHGLDLFDVALAADL